MDVEELNITIKKSPQHVEKANTTSTEREPGLSSGYQLMFWRKPTGASDGLVCEGCLNGGCGSVSNLSNRSSIPLHTARPSPLLAS